MHLDEAAKSDFVNYPKVFHGCNPAKLVEILCNGLKMGNKLGQSGVYLSEHDYTAVRYPMELGETGVPLGPSESPSVRCVLECRADRQA